MSSAIITYAAARSNLGRVLAYATFTVVALSLILLVALRVMVFKENTEHFVYLANALAQGSFAVDSLPSSYQDKVIFKGHTFVPLGPMPAIVLIPMAAVRGLDFDEFWAGAALTLASVWVLNRILLRLAITLEKNRYWVLVLFFGGTIYLSSLVQGNSWFLSHILTTFFLLLAINEGLSQQRGWLVGLWLGAAFLTRVTSVLGIVFFLFVWWRGRQLSVRRLASFGMGFLPALVFSLYYNMARFGSPFETGYGHAVVLGPVLSEAMSHGLFSLVHVPKNLYMLFLAAPRPVPSANAPVLEFPYVLPSEWGMSIFLTTPAFVYAFRARRETLVSAAWLAVLAIGIPLMLYYGVGWIQFGYRYALDFYPFLMIPTALGINARWGWQARAVILLCVLVNIWGAWCSLLGVFAKG